MNSMQLQQRYKEGDRDFRGLQLTGANLVWFELSGVDLRAADLSHANLSGANLSEANLSGGTNLAFADLSRTDLRNTNLKGTRLEGANLEGAMLAGAIYDETTRFPTGFAPEVAGAIMTGETQPPTTTLTTASPSESTVPTPEQPEDASDFHTSETRTQPEQTAYPRAQFNSPEGAGKQTLQQAFNAFQRIAQPILAKAIAQLKQSVQTTQTYTPNLYGANGFGNTSGQGRNGVVPREIQGWNWGGFLLPGLWFLSNQVWSGFLMWIFFFIPLINVCIILWFAIAFGKRGNEYAWKSRPWNSIQAFRAHQRSWAIAGFAFWGFILFVWFSIRR
jgi:uncharacterized protein YjbI with pentapeptide repeats